MNRWAVRIAGLLMLLMFLFLFAQLQKQLIELQKTRRPAPARTR